MKTVVELSELKAMPVSFPFDCTHSLQMDRVMHAQQAALARKCLKGAEHDSMTFPEIIRALTDGGFEGYTVDFHRATVTYYLPTGESIELATHESDLTVSETFDPDALKAVIREAQTLAPGYTYAGFCSKARVAGCAGYMVSFTGRRALYFGRTAETYVEHFPQ
jgi:uncharacterized protein YbcV (DUF1398 family)